MARKKKKHVCSCGETFPHGIGLRKHQRQTGHKGSEIIDEDAAPPAPASEEPEPAAPAPTAKPAPPEPRAVPVEPDPEPDPEPESDETVVVSRPQATSRAQTQTQEPPPQFHSAPPRTQEGPSRLQHNRQKLSLIGRGLKVLFAYRAKTAGKQLKQSARSGADIFAEAAKLAAALICLLGIPIMLFVWWNGGPRNTRQNPKQPETFTFQDGPLAARSSVLRYLDFIGKQNWEAAYGQLSPGWRAEMTGSRFRDAFLDIDDLRWAVNTQQLDKNGNAVVSVRLAFNEGGKKQNFLAYFRLERSGKDWKIDRAELVPESTP